MSNIQRYKVEVWDRLFDFLSVDDEAITDAEIDADLDATRIDIRRGLQQFQAIIEQHKARIRYAQAGETREKTITKLKNVITPKSENLRTAVKELIGRVFTGPELIAHYHKLDKMASDEDMQSLMDDLNKLAAMREQQNNDKKSS